MKAMTYGDKGKKSVRDDGRVTAMDLDAMVHERLRLGILSALAANDSMSFTELRGALGATDGNLGVQARKLEEAGYVEVGRERASGRNRTIYRITEKGRSALERYLDILRRVLPPLADDRGAEEPGDEGEAGGLPTVASRG